MKSKLQRSILCIAIFLSLFEFSAGMQADWIKLDPRQRISPRRSGHTAFVSDDRTPFVFGGYVEEDEGESAMKRYVTNDLWKWKEDTWQQVKQSGAIPQSRLVAAAAAVDGKVYLFGGWDPQTEGTGGVILDSVHELNLDSMSWKKLKTTVPDGPTSRHIAVPLQQGVLLHNHRCKNYVLIFDPASQQFTKQPTVGPCPSSRGLHAATVVSDTKVIIFGGAAQDGTMSNEAFLLDTSSWEWKVLADGEGPCPSPRAGPCLCTYNDNCVVLFGGAEATESGLRPRGDVWALHLNENRWELLIDDAEDETEQTRPPPRNAASLAEIDVDGKRCFLLTGGWAPFRQTWDDCYALRLI